MKVFVSYSHKDFRLAKAITRYLSRRGHDPWIDSEDIPGCVKWAQTVNEALEQSDAAIGILTRDSVRRPEVIRELVLALDCVDGAGQGERRYPLVLVVVGKIHDSWFAGKGGGGTERVIRYMHEYQHVSLDAHGDLTVAAMSELASALEKGPTGISAGPSGLDEGVGDEVPYVCETGMPKEVSFRVKGSEGEWRYHRVRPSDLSLATVYPFALDNQWVPQSVRESDDLRGHFAKEGFASEEIRTVVEAAQMRNLCLALIHARQAIVNKSAFLNSGALRRLYCSSSPEDPECAAFRGFLRDGSLVVFLYGDHETSPASKAPAYETSDGAVGEWNKLCKDVSPYCIREDWNSELDRHSIDFVRFATTLSDDFERNIRIANSLGVKIQDRDRFLGILKDVSMQALVQAHFTGTNVYESMRGLSRSWFYRNFIVRGKSTSGGAEAAQPVLNCLLDEKKPFCWELKRIVDAFYNSLFANYFQCRTMLADDTAPESLFIEELYLGHGTMEVTSEELEYAISEFIEELRQAGSITLPRVLCKVECWDLAKIAQLRKTPEWNDYLDLVESSLDRVQEWDFDFSAVLPLCQAFSSALWSLAGEREPSLEVSTFSFRLCIGSSVFDLVFKENRRLVLKHPGIADAASEETPLLVFFQLEDISRGQTETVLSPLLLFDGKTDGKDEREYCNEVEKFLSDYLFEELSNA